MSTEPIGARLKRIRQEKGLSLEEVRKRTKIHQNILKAIEGDSLTNLSPVYLKGFLKIYCKFLGVDPKECIPDYKEPAAVPSRPAAPEAADKPLKPASFIENAGVKLRAWRPDKRLKNAIVFILIAAIAVLIVFSLVKFISSRPKAPAFKPRVQTSAVKPQFSGARIPKEAGGAITLVISAKENCLVLVKVDGKVVLHRVLEKGRSDSWKANEKIELSLGNAAAVELIVNGQRFTNLGRKGQQIKNITITEKDGLRISR